MMRTRTTLTCLIIAVLTATAGWSPASADDSVIRWNQVVLNAIRSAEPPPPVAARNLAIVHVAIYDAVNGFDRDYDPYLVDAHAPEDASLDAAIAGAAYETLVELFPTLVNYFDAQLAAALAGIDPGPAYSGVSYGMQVADKILKARSNDGSDDVVAYTPGTALGDWVPTPPAFLPALLPQWPLVTPFAMVNGNQFRPAGPPELDSDDFADAFDEVQSLGEVDSRTRTAEQTQIAFFWADGAGTATPPGHWNEIAQDVASAEETSVVENARLFALLNIALADAGIAAWDAKYAFNFWRPVTAIRAPDSGNDDTEGDPDWTPLLGTPNFPATISGHSTFSAAGALVLAGFFGTDDIQFTSSSDSLPNVTRTFDSFTSAAAEAGQSRIYGGIHWQFDNQEGLGTGAALGEYVFRNFLRPAETARTKRP